MTVQKLADKIYGYFKKLKRDSGDEVWITKDGTPEDVIDMFHEAHGDMGPDDWKYEFIVEALAKISETEGDDNLDSPEIEPDVYTGELLSWLSSNLTRPSYVDEAVNEFGHSDQGIIGDIMMGQVKEKEEVYFSILNSLREKVEE